MFELSEKQQEVLNAENKRLNFLIGSVRSGKTFVSLLKWLKYVQHETDDNLIMVGRTASTIKRNIVDEICRIIGSEAKYYIGKGELHLWDKTIYLIPANDERAEGKIRGMTCGGAYIDEASLMPESFFKMLLSRITKDTAKLIATTNPDTPFHYLKKEYIDNKELDINVFDFKLDDNPSLSKSFKDNLKKEYTGLWYKRFILGEWCLAEGTIYDFFDERIHVMDFPPDNPRYYVVGVDYGTTNPCGFGLFGYNPDTFPNIWMEEEYYWNSREKMRQKTDSEYAEDLKKFIAGKNVKAIIVDPSAASFKAECIKQGIQNIVDADNDVLNGIRFSSKMMSNGTFKVCKKCQNMIKEMYTYVWDDKSIRLGEDRPLKQNDHMSDLTRYVLYTYFKPMYDGTYSMSLDDYRNWKAEQGWQ